jgi:hypothetical protein
MAETFRVENLLQALNLAENFKLSGKYNLFRGQAQNWKVQSTIGRLSEKSFEEMNHKLIRLYRFFETEESLQKYKTNIDWFFAVAQHYGIPTSYLDFTNNAEIAAYFATNSKSNKVGEDCVIICLNEDDFARFVKLTDILYKKEKVIPPYITRINVDNLWRLQAQEGCFLFTPFTEIEQYYDFDKIIFPFDVPFDKITKNEIYPKRKSELEILLDQYFNTEKRILGQKRFENFSNETKIPTVHLPKLDTNRVLKNKQIHSSWESIEFKYWQYPIKEEWTKQDLEIIIEINFSLKNSIENQIENIKDQLTIKFKNINRKTRLKFEISTKPKLTKKLTDIVNQSCSRIWDGTRNLPYTCEEIIKFISQYISIEIHFHKYNETYSISKEKLIALEMTNEYGSITRCHASPSKIVSTFRDDLNEIIIDELTENISSEILLNINIPNLLFDFKKLINLFKDELIIYQVLYNSEIENPVIFYTPTQIKICGYA